MLAVTASPQLHRTDHDASPGTRPTHSEGTACESSRRYPCPERSLTLTAYLSRGVWVNLWTCPKCDRALRDGGFKAHVVRGWL